MKLMRTKAMVLDNNGGPTGLEARKRSKKLRREAEVLNARSSRSKRKTILATCIGDAKYEAFEPLSHEWGKRSIECWAEGNVSDRFAVHAFVRQLIDIIGVVGAPVEVLMRNKKKCNKGIQGIVIEHSLNAFTIILTNDQVVTVPKKDTQFKFSSIDAIFWGNAVTKM